MSSSSGSMGGSGSSSMGIMIDEIVVKELTKALVATNEFKVGRVDNEDGIGELGVVGSRPEIE